ncbi:MAG: IPT/TIG domain-containing protein [Bacteroidota bacterium]
MRPKILYFIITLVTSALLLNCEDANISPKEYPYLLMKEVKIDSASTEFIAEIIHLGEGQINQFGFVWSQGTTVDSMNIFIKNIDSTPEAGIFSLKVTSDLKNDTKYTVRPYIQNDKNTVIGNSITFESLGSNPPIINDFLPKSGNSGDTVSIFGSNFSVSKSRIKVFIGKDEANIFLTDFQTIKFILPQNLSYSGKVKISLNSGSYTVESNELFLVEGPKIKSFFPATGIIGETEVVIKGSGFSQSGNKVKIGSYKAIILKENTEEIRIKLPYTLNTGINSIEVEVNGQLAVSESPINIKSRWHKLNDFPSQSRIGGYFGIIKNNGYLICGSADPVCCNEDFNEVWKYNFNNDQWNYYGDFPGMSRSLATGFSIGEKIYYGMGVNDFQRFSDFWEFDPYTGYWKELQNFPGSSRYNTIQFTLNNKGYIIGGTDGASGSSDVWEYNPINDTWKLIGYIPTEISRNLNGRDIFSQSESTAFLVPTSSTYTNSLYLFDPNNSNILTKLTELPFYPDITTIYTAFIIKNDIYIGGGDHAWKQDNMNPEFWKYNIESNKWTKIESFLGGNRTWITTTTYNNYGYLMFGEKTTYYPNTNTQLFPEVWKYDPSK